MRTYTEVAEDRFLGVIPASALVDLRAAFVAIVKANRSLAVLHEARKGAS